MNSIEDIEAAAGIELPDSYKDFIRPVRDFTERWFNDEDGEEDDDFPGRPWFLWGLDRMARIIEMKGVGSAPKFRALSLYTKVFSEFASAPTVYSPQGAIPVERVASGFVVGEENGDYLYLDPSDGFSVWIYYHDGGDVKKVSPSYEQWLHESTEA